MFQGRSLPGDTFFLKFNSCLVALFKTKVAMHYFCQSLGIFLLALSGAIACRSGSGTNSRLMDELFSSYDRRVNPDCKTTAHVIMEVMDIMFDPEKQVDPRITKKLVRDFFHFARERHRAYSSVTPFEF